MALKLTLAEIFLVFSHLIQKLFDFNDTGMKDEGMNLVFFMKGKIPFVFFKP